MNFPDGWNDDELARADRLARTIRSRPGGNAKIFAARAPGRVNLIGEHTDYSGLPVLPIAIDRSTIVVARANATSQIDLSNADAEWPPRRFMLERHIPSYPTGDWANYVKAALQGVIDHFVSAGMPLDRVRGVSMLVEGQVPLAAGLSSSAALTVSTAMAFMAANRLELAPLEIASMVARSEWYVGTRAGGMDQAASILGRRDHALMIEFNPLRVRAVKMPSNLALVVADSLEVADKSGKVRAEYNRRVVECALAARIIGLALKLDGVRILGDVVRARQDLIANQFIEALAASAPAKLGADLRDASNILNASRAELESNLLGDGATRIVLDPNRPLEVLKRARHVLSETERVFRAADALAGGRLAEMGELMNASHRSLADDFECSTGRLDSMVELAIRGGALGARLTGAGFGGSIVALCETESAPAVIESLDRGYYSKLSLEKPVENYRAVLRASAGASVIELAPE